MSVQPLALVTGAAGFIGSHMVDVLLEKGYRVRGLDNLCNGSLDNLQHLKGEERFEFVEKDINDLRPDEASFTGVQHVFHFAGIGDIVPSIDQPTDYMETNSMGTVKVLEASRYAEVKKLVYAASSSCYGENPPAPTDEACPIAPEYPYALSKYLGECSVLHWGKVYRLPVNSIRIFNAYGLRSKNKGAYGAVFKVFLAQKIAGKPYTVVGDGNQKRDFVYVTDVARGFLAAAETDAVNEIYNLGAGNPQTVNHLVGLLGGEKIHIPKRPGEPEVTWADIKKITDELNWKPQISFEEGVKIMLAHIDYWSQATVWDAGSIEKATETWFKMLSKT